MSDLGLDSIETLKPLDQILLADPRYDGMQSALELIHARLRVIVLHGGVPREVRQQFETAKNLYLYSWFVYRFRIVAEFIAFGALEKALFIRWDDETSGSEKPRRRRDGSYQGITFRTLLEIAQEHRWIDNSAFGGFEQLIKYRASMRKVYASLEQQSEGLDSVEMPETTPNEIALEREELNVLGRQVKNLPRIRNAYAHGNLRMRAVGTGRLELTADMINALYASVGGNRRERK